MTIDHEDDVPRGPLMIGLIASVIGLLVAVGATWALTDCGRQLRSDSLPGEMPDEVNAIEARIFPLETDAERERRDAATRLRSWGWSDRERRLIHMPVDIAIDEYLQEPRR